MNYKDELILSGAGFKKLLEREYEIIQEKYGILKIDLQIITFLLYYGEKNTSRDIVELFFFTKGHVSQSITRLRKRNIIRTEKDKKDRRYQHIYFEKNAEDIINDIKKLDEKIMSVVFKDFTQEEKEMFRKVAVKISENIDKAI